MTKKDIYKSLKKELDAKRYEHTLGVAHTAACLAMKWNEDMDKAFLAGLLHDCAKGMSDKERLDYCKKQKIAVTEVEKANPSLLHAKAGADMANKIYGIEDESILDAIKWHTTGHPDMSLLEEIVFIADYIEPNRAHDPELITIRQEAFSDLHRATLHVYKNTLEYLSNSTKQLDPTTKESYMYYKNLEE